MVGNSLGWGFFWRGGVIKIGKQFFKKVKNKYLPKFEVLMSKQAFCPCPVMLFFCCLFGVLFWFVFYCIVSKCGREQSHVPSLLL